MGTGSRMALMLIVIALPLLFGEADAAAPDDPEIEKLVRDLGSKDFRVRQGAGRRLTELEAFEPLRRALKSDDPEVARLADRALKNLERSGSPRFAQKLRREIADGKASLAIDRFARWDGPKDDAASWQLMIDFAWDVVKRATEKHLAPVDGWLSPSTVRLIKTVKQVSPERGQEELFIRARQPVTISDRFSGFVRAEGIKIVRHGFTYHSVFTSSDGMKADASIRQSIILVAGPARIRGAINTILICDGDIDDSFTISHSLVIANGSVKCDIAGQSVIVAAGKITSKYKRDDPLNARTIWIENEPNPFGFIKWFTTSEVGLEVVAAKDAVRIEKLHDGQLPIKSGLKVDDIVTAVDGTKVDSPDTFRRGLLRGVVNERCMLSVKRAQQNLDIILDFRAEERAKEKAKDPQKK
jgi:PDZ domain